MLDKIVIEMYAIYFRIKLSYRAILFTGVLWNLFSPIPGIGDALKDLEASGKEIVYVSNNSFRPDSSYKAKITKLGYKFKQENLVHPVHSIVRYFKKINFQGLCYVIGATEITSFLRNAGVKVLDGPNELVEEDLVKLYKRVADKEPVKFVFLEVDFNFGYSKYLRAELYLRDPECQLIIGATDQRLPITPDFDLPGPGYFVDALVAALPPEKKPIILGKPGETLGDILKEQFQVKDPKRVLFVGDMISTDIQFAHNVGFQSLLVLSGGTSREKMLASEDGSAIPDFYANSLADLSTLISSIPPPTRL